MGTVSYYHHSETTVDGVRYPLGDLSTPVSVTYGDDEVHAQRFNIANGGTQEIFDTADDLPDYDYMVVKADAAMLMQIVIDDDATAGEVFVVFTLTANIPFVFPNKAALAGDGTVDQFDGTADTIDRVTIKNTTGAAANVTVQAFT